MPQPQQFDPRLRPPPVSCPVCFRSMRINEIELADGREIIRLVCDDCGEEATQNFECEH
jgi:hypothetical protein